MVGLEHEVGRSPLLAGEKERSMSESNADITIKPGQIEKPAPIAGFENFGHIPLEGMANVRDLGGMPTTDGRAIKMGRLLRSDALHHATEADLGWLMGTCNVQRVFDFRSVEERQMHPDPQGQMEGVVFYETPVFNVASVGLMPHQGIEKDATALHHLAKGLHPMILSVYPKCLLEPEGIAAYHALFEALLGAEDGATLWHCTEGKDRTGLGAVLVEHALGVSDEDIRKDYLATNLFAQTAAERIADAFGRHHVAEKMDIDLDAVFYAFEDYLDAALDAVNEKYGNLDWYMEEQLGIGPAERKQLQEMYLV